MKHTPTFRPGSWRFCLPSIALAMALLGPSTNHAANILYIINSLSDPNTTANAHDQEVRDRLVGQGHKVTLADDTVVSPADLAGIELVLISSSCGSGEPGVNPLCKNTLRTGRVPVVNYEPALNDELLMQISDTYGNATGHTSLGIVGANKGHPLASGKSGIVDIVGPGDSAVISSSALPLTIGKEAMLIATNATPGVDEGRVAIWAHDIGSHLADNTTVASSRRVAFFFNASTSPGTYNDVAYALFDAAVKWVLENRPSLAPPFVSDFSLNPTGLNIKIEDGSGAGATQVNASSVKLTYDGGNVTPDVKKTGSTTTVIYKAPTLLLANSQHKAELTFADSAGKTQTVAKDFTLALYNLIPAAFAVKPDTSKPGFRVRVHQVSETQGNTNTRTEDQLAGRLKGADGTVLPNIADLSAAGPDGYFTEEGVLNYNQDAPGNAGNFNSGNGYEDKLIPGIPGIEGGADNIAAEILTFLDLPAGLVRMGVNSDDGFLTSVVVDPSDKYPLRLGAFDGGRGAADTVFEFVVEKAGAYPFRTIWEEGQGGANVEWFSVTDDGKKILINDKNNTAAIKAYRVATGGGVPIVKSLTPDSGTGGIKVNASAKFEIVVVDNVSAVAPSTIQLSLSGKAATPTVSKSGKETTISYTAAAGSLASGTTYTARFTVGDSSTPPNLRTIDLVFTTERLPITLGAFEQSSDGLVVMEAENYHALTPQGDHTWTFNTAKAGFSSDGYLDAVPDSGVNQSVYPDLLTQSPRLDYKVKFVKSGTHYVWIRGMAPGAAEGKDPGANDSINAGIDGDQPDSARRIDVTFPGDAWALVGTIQGGTRATIQVSSVGEHTVNIWMREDGFRFDKVIIASTESFAPAGLGPAESLHVGGQPPVQAKFNPVAFQANNLTISWTGTGKLQQADSITGPWTDASSQTNPQTVAIGGPAKFYRLRQ